MLLAIVFAVIAALSAGAGSAALAARLATFVTKVRAALVALGKIGPLLLKIFGKLDEIGQLIVRLVRALKRKIEEVARGATDSAVRIVRGTRVPQKAKDTLGHVKRTGNAPPGYRGGRTFKNDGRGGGEILPRTDSSGNPITYREYDVNPYQQGVNRGAERIVVGSDGKAYYTSDHYTTFTRME